MRSAEELGIVSGVELEISLPSIDVAIQLSDLYENVQFSFAESEG